MGLLDSVLVSLAATAPHAAPAQQAPLGDLLGSLSRPTGSAGLAGGGDVGLQGPLLQAVVALLASDAPGGGLATMVRQFSEGGLGDVMASWVGTGANRSVSPEQLGQVLGSDHLDGLARQFGVSHGVLLGQLSQMLPQVVDRLTPTGAVPAGGLGPMAELVGSLLRR